MVLDGADSDQCALWRIGLCEGRVILCLVRIHARVAVPAS